MICPEADALMDAATLMFGLSAPHICWRVRDAWQAAGLDWAFCRHSPRAGVAQDVAAAGGELPARDTASQEGARGVVTRYYAAKAG